MNEGRDFFEQLRVGMGSLGYDEWMHALCERFLGDMDRFYFRRTNKTFIKFIAAKEHYFGFTESLVSVPLLEYAYANDLFLWFAQTGHWEFRIWNMELSDDNGLELIIWLNEHRLLDPGFLFPDIISHDVQSCVDYAFAQKWYIGAKFYNERAIKSRKTLDLFVQHGLFPGDGKKLHVWCRNELLADWIVCNQHLPACNFSNFIHAKENNLDRLLFALTSFIDENPHLTRLIIQMLGYCDHNDHQDWEHFYVKNRCIGKFQKLARFIPADACHPCDHPENHFFKRRKTEK